MHSWAKKKSEFCSSFPFLFYLPADLLFTMMLYVMKSNVMKSYIMTLYVMMSHYYYDVTSYDIKCHNVICPDVIFHDVIFHDFIFYIVIFHDVMMHDEWCMMHETHRGDAPTMKGHTQEGDALTVLPIERTHRGGRTHNATQRTDTHIFTGGGYAPSM